MRKRTALLALGVLVLVAVAGCSPATTAIYKQKPVEQVTPADRVDAWNAWLAVVAQQRQATRDDVGLTCIRSHESAGEPNPWAAFNPGGPYFGAYQFVQGTWNNAATLAGRPDLVGLEPMEPYVSGWDQDAVTLIAHRAWGDGPWGNRCPVT